MEISAEESTEKSTETSMEKATKKTTGYSRDLLTGHTVEHISNMSCGAIGYQELITRFMSQSPPLGPTSIPIPTPAHFPYVFVKEIAFCKRLRYTTPDPFTRSNACVGRTDGTTHHTITQQISIQMLPFATCEWVQKNTQNLTKSRVSGSKRTLKI